ncbi:peptide methionine sulfoxide reductase A5 isoform X2 [Vitis riparia]|uniref:peptide methionine sulfoxide reductase A5 isoform X2 n=1 Tax=Vitis riparia TaxID=96939 RepID=UPI00155AC429|nr:peptide methionine sulfoxide reductase A5 isoform X2 [Vitis riparia]
MELYGPPLVTPVDPRPTPSTEAGAIMPSQFSVFDRYRGLKQGDPMSPYLFVVAMKTLSYLLKGASEIEYNPRLITFRQLLEVFWSSHDSRQVFGQGPDVGNQYRSIIFTNGTEELRLAAVSKEREQTVSKSSIVTTQIQQLGKFCPAEPEHQKFELKRNPFLLQLMGNLPEEELEKSTLAAKLNGFAAELCPPKVQQQINARIEEIIRKGWPILREV